MITEYFFGKEFFFRLRNVDFAENRISDPKMVVGAPEMFFLYEFSFPFHHSSFEIGPFL